VWGLDFKRTCLEPRLPFSQAILVSAAVAVVKATPQSGRRNGRALTTTTGTGQIGLYGE
jgi:hypothetical protein